MDDYAGRVLADRYRLPLPPSEEYELTETRAFDTYSGQEVLVRQVPLPEVVEAEVLDAEGLPDGFAAARERGVPVRGAASARRPADPAVRRAVEAAQAAARIPDHPRLDQVFDVFADGGSLWVVSELVAARPLAALLAERTLTPYRAAEVASDVVTALRVLHAHGWVHRNITARTVLVCDDGRVMLTGLAVGAAEEALCGYDPVPAEDGPLPGAGAPGVQGPGAGTTAAGAVSSGGTGAQGITAGDAEAARRAAIEARAAGGLPPASATTSNEAAASRAPAPRAPDTHGDIRAARAGAIAAYRAGARAAARVQEAQQNSRAALPGARTPGEDEGGAEVSPYGAPGVGAAGGSRSGPAGSSPYADQGIATAGTPGGGTAGERGASGGAAGAGAEPPGQIADPYGVRRPPGPAAGAGVPRPTGPVPPVPAGFEPRTPDGFASPALGDGRRPDGFASQGPGEGRRPDGFVSQGSGEGGRADGFVSQGPGEGRRPDGFVSQSSGEGGRADGFVSQGSGEGGRPGGFVPPAPGHGRRPAGLLPPGPVEGVGHPSRSSAGAVPAARAEGVGPAGSSASAPGWGTPADGKPGARGPATALAAERARQARMAVVGPVTERWAPEQAGPVHENWQLAAPIGPATDLWALGALLFRAVQGHAPYPEESTAELVQMVCAEPPAFAEECGPLRPVVESLLRQDPTERPDFEELRGWLRSLVRSAPEPEAGTHVIAAPPADPTRLPIVRRRGELVRRRRAGLPAHARHKRRETARSPRSLGRTLLVLILLALAAAIAYAMLFMPKSGDNAGAERTGGVSATGGTAGGPQSPSSEPRPDDQTSPAPQNSGSSAPETQSGGGADVADGFTLRTDEAGFRIAVANGWDRAARGGRGQVVYSHAGFELIVVPGRDSAAEYGSDPMAYQRERESELQPYRDSSWATASGLRTTTVGGRTMAEGQFTWTGGDGRELFVRNLAILLDGRYHVIQLRGPEAERDEVTRLYEQASSTYQYTG
ncbi:protein kinase [Streptomyces sp. NPDC018693]|uniref:protein kinase n=1 Tax=unclassified Streptomyces TaxID=2593676 RepID=UPI0037A1E198